MAKKKAKLKRVPAKRGLKTSLRRAGRDEKTGLIDWHKYDDGQSSKNLTDYDAALIDDIRQAYIRMTVSLPNGSFFDGSTLASQAGFEKAVAKVVLERTYSANKPFRK